MGSRPALERPLCIDYEYHNSTVFFFFPSPPLPLCQPPTPISPPHPPTPIHRPSPSLYNAKVLIGPSGGLSAFDLITATVTLH